MSLIARVGRSYQVVIPKEVRRKLGIKEGDMVIFEIDDDEVKIRKVKNFMNMVGTLKGKLLPPGQLRDKIGEEIARDAL